MTQKEEEEGKKGSLGGDERDPPPPKEEKEEEEEEEEVCSVPTRGDLSLPVSSSSWVPSEVRTFIEGKMASFHCCFPKISTFIRFMTTESFRSSL